MLEDAVSRMGYVEGVVVEVGCGEGYLVSRLLEHTDEVIGIDIHLESLTRAWSRLREMRGSIHLIQGDMLSCIRKTDRIRVIVANPPYLPNDEEFHDPTIHGGESGVEAILRIVEEAVGIMGDKANILLIASSLSSLDRLAKYNLYTRVIAEKKLFFEKLYCLNISPTRLANR